MVIYSYSKKNYCLVNVNTLLLHPRNRSSQQELVEARQLIKSLASKGVLEQTPELKKLMEVLEQVVTFQNHTKFLASHLNSYTVLSLISSFEMIELIFINLIRRVKLC